MYDVLEIVDVNNIVIILEYLAQHCSAASELFWWQVNKMDRVAVSVHVYSYSKTTIPVLPQIWSDAPEAKFNIIAAVSEAAHRMRGLEYKPDPDTTRTDNAVRTRRSGAIRLPPRIWRGPKVV